MKDYTVYLVNPATGLSSARIKAAAWEIKGGYAVFSDEQKNPIAIFVLSNFVGFAETPSIAMGMSTMK